MNGASHRLLKLREALEQNRDDLGLAILDFATARRAIERIDFIHDELQGLIEALRNAETLALAKNWRLILSVDLPGAIVFLNEIDPNILSLALGRCDSRVLDFLRARLEMGGSPKTAEPDKDGVNEAIPQQD
jgi:hypothetical protein